MVGTDNSQEVKCRYQLRARARVRVCRLLQSLRSVARLKFLLSRHYCQKLQHMKHMFQDKTAGTDRKFFSILHIINMKLLRNLKFVLTSETVPSVPSTKQLEYQDIQLPTYQLTYITLFYFEYSQTICIILPRPSDVT